MNTEPIPQPAMVGDDTVNYSGEVVATKSNGIKVPVQFTFTYPRGEGITLAQVIDEFGELAGGQNVFGHLLNVGDASLLAAAAMANGGDDDYDDDTDNDYDEDED